MNDSNDSIIIGSKNIYHDIDCKINRSFFYFILIKRLAINFCDKYLLFLINS